MHFFSLWNSTVVPFQNPDKTIPMPKKKKRRIWESKGEGWRFAWKKKQYWETIKICDYLTLSVRGK